LMIILPSLFRIVPEAFAARGQCSAIAQPSQLFTLVNVKLLSMLPMIKAGLIYLPKTRGSWLVMMTLGTRSYLWTFSVPLRDIKHGSPKTRIYPAVKT
jgi:hypothetical protein